MKKSIYGLFGLLILLIGAPAEADTLYFAAQAGFSTAPTSDNEDPNNPGNNFELNTQNGVNAALAVGTKFGMLRGEIEGVYRYNPNDKFVDSGGAEGADGSLSMINIFLNGDLEYNILGIVSPYVGVEVRYRVIA